MPAAPVPGPADEVLAEPHPGPRWTAMRPELVSAAVATLLAGAYLLAGLMGGDLAAQMARADFAHDHPLTPVDLRWFGGFQPLGYSLWTPWLMALVGVRLTGAVATVLAVWLTARLLRLTGAFRPTWGGVAAAVTLSSNLIEGRVTFACGVACALAALLALVPPGSHGMAPSRRRVLAGVLATLAGTASPVAAMLLAVVAAALLSRRRIADAAILALPALVSAGVMSVTFADPGRGLFSGNDAVRAIGASVLVAVLVPSRLRVVRVGALVGALLVLVVYLVPTPIGVSAARLSLLFAVPIVVAFARVPAALVPVAVAISVAVQSPVTLGTLNGAGAPATTAAYYRPLTDQIRARGPVTGRTEIPELTGHWEAAYVARTMPLARGWIRQTDIGLNDATFYRHPPTAASFRAFLERMAVQYVAVADARPTFYGRRERDLVQGGLPYLRRVWASEHWTLYAVRDAVPIVGSPATPVSSDAARITLDAPPRSMVPLRMRWFAWLSLDDGGDRAACLQDVDGRPVLHTGTGGRYTVTSVLHPTSTRCP